MAIIASLPNHNLFSSLPSSSPTPSSPPPSSSSFSPPIPIPKYPSKPLKTHQKPHKKSPPNPPKPPAFTNVPHNKTKYYKPISPNSPSILPSPSNNGTARAVVIKEDGLSYRLPGAPFEFKFSYSETPKAQPIAIREPAYLPFAPPTMPRPWTGKAPLLSKKEKLLKKKKIPLYDGFNPYENGGGNEKRVEIEIELEEVVRDERRREEIIGEPLSRAEIKALVKPLVSVNRQVNLGRDGLTHNMLDLIYSHWKRQEVCKVKCKGVPTLDMDNVCRCLEEKTGGKIIHRAGGVVYLFRGRNYNHRTRPRLPIMLWKPAAPVYPKLIQEAPGGLTKEEADELRRKGRGLLAICKLAKNGVYISLVNDVRQAFEGSELVKVDCRGLEPSDYKKIGAKLMELVPCVLLSFDEEQILMWRGHDWKSMYRDFPMMLSTSDACNDKGTGRSDECSNEPSGPSHKQTHLSPRMMSLWQCAIESNKALLLDQFNLGPDALLEKVEEFEAIVQATEHSYPAVVYSRKERMSNSETEDQISENDEEFNDWSTDEEEDEDEFEDYDNDPFDQPESPGTLGSLPVDLIVKRVRGE